MEMPPRQFQLEKVLIFQRNTSSLEKVLKFLRDTSNLESNLKM